MNTLERMKSHQEDFSKTELKIYDYILADPGCVEQNTITRMAALCEVSTSAILRFCQLLGFKGYKDFRFEMMSDLKNGDRPQLEPEKQNLENSYYEYIRVFDQMKQVDFDQIKRLAQALIDHRPIYVMGIYYSSLPARMLVMGLQDQGIHALWSDDYVSGSHLFASMKEDGMLIVFSVYGEKTYVHRFLNEVNEKVPDNSWLITLNPKAPLASCFAHTIVLPGYEMSRASVVATQSVCMAFCEQLLNQLHTLRHTDSTDHQKENSAR